MFERLASCRFVRRCPRPSLDCSRTIYSVTYWKTLRHRRSHTTGQLAEYNVQVYYAAFLIGRITGFAHTSVRPSVRPVVRALNSETKRRRKTKNCRERSPGPEQPTCRFSAHKVKGQEPTGSSSLLVFQKSNFCCVAYAINVGKTSYCRLMTHICKTRYAGLHKAAISQWRRIMDNK